MSGAFSASAVGEGGHRRVLAVLAYLRAADAQR